MKYNSNLNPVKFIRRNRIPVDELDPVHCENCNHEFKGHFCPNCGQEVAEFNRPFGFVLYDFAGNFFAFDTRFFRTFWYLLSKPGFLTTEFFKGRRVRYSPPFRLFVFLSFALFLLLQVLTEKSLNKSAELKISGKSGKVSANSNLKLNASVVTDIDSLKIMQSERSDSTAMDNDLRIDLTDLGKGSFRDNLTRIAGQYEKKLPEAKDQAEKEKISSRIAMLRAPEMAISILMKYLSWTFFLLLPIFALILKLFYIRRNQLYIRHLIFSIHLHSYLFFILIIIAVLKLIFDSGLSGISGILLLTFPIYFILALRKFYGQTFGKIILKFLGISIIYNVVLWSAVLFVFVKVLGVV